MFMSVSILDYSLMIENKCKDFHNFKCILEVLFLSVSEENFIIGG